MKNHQYIRQYISRLKVKDLAPFLIQEHIVPDYDEDLDGEWSQCGESVEYILPNGDIIVDAYDEAVFETINWLNAECDEEKIERLIRSMII